MSKSYVAIGDIHGCDKTLDALWKTLHPHRNAIHIFLGDYIDRGPRSKKVVNFLLNAQNQRECIFLKGNHEKMLLDAYQYGGRHLDNWLYNGGKATLDSYDITDVRDLPKSHLEFYKNTKMFYDTPDYFFVHAGIPPDKSVEKNILENPENGFYLWGREHLNARTVPWEKTVVFGHTPRAFPIRKNKMIGIDTGCVYNEVGYKKLTAVVLPEMNFIQQESLDHEAE